MSNKKAEFIERDSCINCGSDNLITLSKGEFSENPLHNFIKNDPWGESPIPYIKDESWDFVECGVCRQKYHKKILSSKWINKCYTEWVTQDAMKEFLSKNDTPAHHFQIAQNNILHALHLEKLTRDLRKGGDLRILDFGCGWGLFLTACDNFGFKSYGVDFSPDRRQEGRVHIFPNIEDLKKNTDGKLFHAITMFEVLEHVADPFEVLQSLSELLEIGGVLILETPDCSGVTDIVTDSDYRKIHPLSHINAFTPNTLRSIAERAGFKLIDRGTAYVTSDPIKVLKAGVKSVVKGFMKKKTQQYFKKYK